MKNILNIEVNSICQCNCYENIVNGADEIILRFLRDNPTNPRLLMNGEECALEFIDGVAIFHMDLNWFMENTIAEFKFLDDGYDGTVFTIRCEDYAQRIGTKTLQLFQYNYDQYKYLAKLVSLSPIPIGDGLKVNEDGEIVLDEKELKSISLTKTNDLVTNVKFTYKAEEEEEEEETSYDVEYDANNNVTKFGDVEVLWQ